MYRTNDPRFRRRLNEIGQTLESANESAQSNIYIFGQNYVKPCFESVANCFTTCVDASCPSLNIARGDRVRRQRGQTRSRGRAELNFDFYDDWDEDENDGLLGWGTSDFDHLVAGSGAGSGGAAGYGTITHAQPGRQRGMSYPKGRRKSAGQRDADPTTVVQGTSLLGRLFGSKSLKYRPSAADLQDHPGKRGLARDRTEGEALLEEYDEGGGHTARPHRRARSGTATSGHTTDSFSSRGDLFPSDEEDDAIPLDDEFAMVLERRTTMTGAETESSSNKTAQKKGKRPSAASRTSTKRTVSSRSDRSSGKRISSHASSLSEPTPPPAEESTHAMAEADVEDEEIAAAAAGEEQPPQPRVPSLSELKQEEAQIAQEEEADVERKRREAQTLAARRGLSFEDQPLSSKEAHSPRSPAAAAAVVPPQEPSQLPTPLPTDDEEDGPPSPHNAASGHPPPPS